MDGDVRPPTAPPPPAPPGAGQVIDPAEKKLTEEVSNWWLGALPAALAVVVGFFMVICTGGEAGPGQSGLGFLLLVLGIAVVVVALLTGVRPKGPRGVVARLLAGAGTLVIFASIVVALAAVAGQLVRWTDPADYAGRYGTRVTATLPKRCVGTEVRRPSGLKYEDADVTCEHSTWQLDGVSQQGTLVISPEDELSGGTIPESVEAYVLDGEGYSVARVGEAENVGLWGGVPLWWLPVGVLGAVLGVVMLMGGWSRPKRDPAAGPTGADPAAGDRPHEAASA
ncbi:hypothetical protein ACFY3U_21575 [Micromonospora sp. NPDC000089]|uniref:hypothetical protein n=1 Tax=unclassified Micromonospora TaxID=2617518 RepID=UPI0036AB7924